MPFNPTSTLRHVLARHPDGLGLSALQRLCPDVPRRTLQRQLARLVADGQLLAVGKARARIYRLLDAATQRT